MLVENGIRETPESEAFTDTVPQVVQSPPPEQASVEILRQANASAEELNHDKLTENKDLYYSYDSGRQVHSTTPGIASMRPDKEKESEVQIDCETCKPETLI